MVFKLGLSSRRSQANSGLVRSTIVSVLAGVKITIMHRSESPHEPLAGRKIGEDRVSAA
jgi:hypothetical protein